MPTQAQPTAAKPRPQHTLHINIPQRDVWESEQRSYHATADISEHARCSSLPVEETSTEEGF